VDVILYRQMVGSLMYLTNMRPYICFVVNTLSQYMDQPRQAHLVATKHVMRYLKGTLDYGLSYVTNHEFRLYGYLDLDWAGNILDRKSTLTYCFSLGSNKVLWSSWNQSCVALSMAEAEYVAACATCREQCLFESCCLGYLGSGLFGLKLEVTCIWCDNQSCMKLSENSVFHDRLKHIKIKYHYIRDIVERGAVRLQYVTTEEQVADVLTKPLSRTKFEHFRDKLGVVPLQRE
jgi:hypothetical protein